MDTSFGLLAKMILTCIHIFTGTLRFILDYPFVLLIAAAIVVAIIIKLRIQGG